MCDEGTSCSAVSTAESAGDVLCRVSIARCMQPGQKAGLLFVVGHSSGKEEQFSGHGLTDDGVLCIKEQSKDWPAQPELPDNG